METCCEFIYVMQDLWLGECTAALLGMPYVSPPWHVTLNTKQARKTRSYGASRALHSPLRITAADDGRPDGELYSTIVQDYIGRTIALQLPANLLNAAARADQAVVAGRIPAIYVLPEDFAMPVADADFVAPAAHAGAILQQAQPQLVAMAGQLQHVINGLQLGALAGAAGAAAAADSDDD
jgi:hypothetical protein